MHVDIHRSRVLISIAEKGGVKCGFN
jgi:hypothetical protein